MDVNQYDLNPKSPTWKVSSTKLTLSMTWTTFHQPPLLLSFMLPQFHINWETKPCLSEQFSHLPLLSSHNPSIHKHCKTLAIFEMT